MLRLLISLALLSAAFVYALNVFRQANTTDDGGPPLGALYAASPAIFLLIAAGAVWSSGRRR